jgi:Fibronectin type III-like domain
MSIETAAGPVWGIRRSRSRSGSRPRWTRRSARRRWPAPSGGSRRRDSVPVDGAVRLGFTVSNTGGRDGVEVVQVYLHDPVASVVRPVQRLVGYARLPLAAGASARGAVGVPADLAAFTAGTGGGWSSPGRWSCGSRRPVWTYG